MTTIPSVDKDVLGGYLVGPLYEDETPVAFPVSATPPQVNSDACPVCRNLLIDCLCDGGAS